MQLVGRENTDSLSGAEDPSVGIVANESAAHLKSKTETFDISAETLVSLSTFSTPPISSTLPAYPIPQSPSNVPLVPFDGIVEHIFFHEVIAFPEVAFRSGSSKRTAFDTEMLTYIEFERVLENLYRNNYIIVNKNDIWSEYTNGVGNLRMRQNTLMLPEGKKPLIISFDDLNFYEYMVGHGFMSKYIIGEDGEIWAYGYDPDGNSIISQDFTAITILDRFINENPGFSHNGARGLIALTGYEGVLGHRTQINLNCDEPGTLLIRRRAIAHVRPVIERLKETGWYFASHSFGHIRINERSFDVVMADKHRWLDEVGSIVGETQIYIYPFGARLDGCDVWSAPGPALLAHVDLGFRMFASVGSSWFANTSDHIPAVMSDRANIDGFALRNRRDSLLRFFDVADVFDHRRPTDISKNW
jgi:hypothetical protein